jgi:hypothetical protein
MAPLSFYEWKARLLDSARTALLTSAVGAMGDRVLELFWRDGMEPSLAAFLDYAQSGLHPVHQARSAKVSDTSVMNQL